MIKPDSSFRCCNHITRGCHDVCRRPFSRYLPSSVPRGRTKDGRVYPLCPPTFRTHQTRGDPQPRLSPSELGPKKKVWAPGLSGGIIITGVLGVTFGPKSQSDRRQTAGREEIQTGGHAEKHKGVCCPVPALQMPFLDPASLPALVPERFQLSAFLFAHSLGFYYRHAEELLRRQ